MPYDEITGISRVIAGRGASSVLGLLGGPSAAGGAQGALDGLQGAQPQGGGSCCSGGGCQCGCSGGAARGVQRTQEVGL